MSATKVTLSPKELELVNNADWILTKNLIIHKVYNLFSEVANNYREDKSKFTSFDSSQVFELAPKISRGEQYQQLPPEKQIYWANAAAPATYLHVTINNSIVSSTTRTMP